jgi:hypothetical protein
MTFWSRLGSVTCVVALLCLTSTAACESDGAAQSIALPELQNAVQSLVIPFHLPLDPWAGAQDTADPRRNPL